MVGFQEGKIYAYVLYFLARTFWDLLGLLVALKGFWGAPGGLSTKLQPVIMEWTDYPRE